jgi:hypothetical protein
VRVVLTVRGPWAESLARTSALINVVPVPSAPQVRVNILPNPIQVLCDERVRLEASVTGLPNARVTWELLGSDGDEYEWGRLSRRGTYRAPSRVPRCSLLAIATVYGAWGEPLASACAPISVRRPAPPPSTVSIAPKPARVTLGGRRRFEVTIGGPRRYRLEWSLETKGCRGHAGTIDRKGVYVAPPVHPGGRVAVVARLWVRGHVVAEDRCPVRFISPPITRPRPAPNQPTPKPPANRRKPKPKLPTSRPRPRPPVVAGKRELGDAPDSSRGRVFAYPGVPGHFPTFFKTKSAALSGACLTQPGQEMLGKSMSRENDADGTADEDGRPNHVNRDADDVQIFLVREGDRFYFKLDITVAKGAPKVPRYINVVVDLNRDGRWRAIRLPVAPTGRRRNRSPAAPVIEEWVVKNHLVNVPSGKTTVVRTSTFSVPDNLLAKHRRKPIGPWMRVLLTRVRVRSKNWDGSGTWTHGEVEDLQLGGPKGSPFAK